MHMKKELVCAAVLAALGCSDNNNKNVTPPAPTTMDAPDLGAAPPTAPPGMALVRVVHLMPDATSIDLCIATHGSGMFRGPLLKQSGVGEGGLAYAQATRYLAVTGAQYDVRLIDGAATSCAHGLIADAIDLPALRPSQSVTIAALGFLHRPASNNNTAALKLYGDEAGATKGPFALRFIHASPDTPMVDAGVGSGNQFTAMFARVAYADVGASSSANPDGYVTMPLTPYAPLLTVRLEGAGDDALTFTPPADPTWGDTVTAFLIGDFGGMPAPFKALVCFDSEAATGALADCAVRP